MNQHLNEKSFNKLYSLIQIEIKRLKIIEIFNEDYLNYEIYIFKESVKKIIGEMEIEEYIDKYSPNKRLFLQEYKELLLLIQKKKNEFQPMKNNFHK